MQATTDDGLWKVQKSAQDNFGKFIHQSQLETMTLVRKLERILIYTDKTCLYYLIKHAYIYIYIYI